jgi:hypothetical protein
MAMQRRIAADMTSGWCKLRANGSVQWQKSLGGSANDEPLAVVQTLDGNFVAAGYTYSNDFDVSGNHGSDDFWVVKVAAPDEQVFYADEDGDGMAMKIKRSHQQERRRICT